MGDYGSIAYGRLTDEHELVMGTENKTQCNGSTVNYYNGDFYDRLNETFVSGTEEFSFVQYLFTVFGVMVTIATVVGNVLVIVAVVTEKKLRKVGNVFIINLAFSDCLVGSVVTPLAIAYDLTLVWKFNSVLCEFWVAMDVICCTASILNLGAISYDRFNAIVNPIKYSRRRTFKRAWLIVLGVWIYSVFIAAPPWFGIVKQKGMAISKDCSVSTDKGYTLYSTIGAFFLPLVVMLYFYARIFHATCVRKNQWRRSGGSRHFIGTARSPAELSPCCRQGSYSPHCPCACCPNVFQFPASQESSADPNKAVTCGTQTCPEEVSIQGTSTVDIDEQRRISLEADLLALYNKKRQSRHLSNVTESSFSSSLFSSTESSQTTTTSASTSSDSAGHRQSISTISSGRRYSMLRTRRISGRHSSLQAEVIHELAAQQQHKTGLEEAGLVSPDTDDGNDEQSEDEGASKHKPLSKIKSFTLRKSNSRKRRRITLTQEKRAAKTLGVVMGCFVICWLPFFLVTLIRPFCTFCQFYPVLLRTATWLGYFNSACNPIIYTFFNKDFRNAFKKLASRHSGDVVFL